jgi:hypothetical protein
MSICQEKLIEISTLLPIQVVFERIGHSVAFWNSCSLLSIGGCGRVMATMQPVLRQTAGCESLKNDSKAQAAFQNRQESLRQQSLSSYQIITKPSTSLALDVAQ